MWSFIYLLNAPVKLINVKFNFSINFKDVTLNCISTSSTAHILRSILCGAIQKDFDKLGQVHSHKNFIETYKRNA